MNYTSWKTNVDADTLSRILWEEHSQHIDAEPVQAFISNVIQDTALVEVYSCHIQVTTIIDTQEDLNAMSLKNWIIVQVMIPLSEK